MMKLGILSVVPGLVIAGLVACAPPPGAVPPTPPTVEPAEPGPQTGPDAEPAPAPAPEPEPGEPEPAAGSGPGQAFGPGQEPGMVQASAPKRSRAQGAQNPRRPKGAKGAPAQAPQAPRASGDQERQRTGAAKDKSGISAMERGIVEEINRLRRDPRAFARVLTRHRGYYDGALLRLPGQSMAIRTNEGVAAVDEAIAVARKSKKRGPLALSPGLSRAARAHAREIGQAGTIAHHGRDGSSPHERMQRHGRVLGLSGENIGTGYGDAAIMVIDLFVDDGVANRGHRVNLMEPRYKVVGVGCAPHRNYGTVCVMGFAQGFEER